MDTYHRLTEVDLETKTGVCSICGPTKITTGKHGSSTKRRCITIARAKGRRKAQNWRQRRGPFQVRKTLLASSEELEAAYEAQDGKCKICGQDRKLVPDHDHSTGILRGWLCLNCNIGLGHFKDSPRLLKKAIEYLLSGTSQ